MGEEGRSFTAQQRELEARKAEFCGLPIFLENAKSCDAFCKDEESQMVVKPLGGTAPGPDQSGVGTHVLKGADYVGSRF